MEKEYKPADYKEYEGKGKKERREIAVASGDLERKRFLLSRNPELRERLNKLQELTNEFQKAYPEIISISLKGSSIKGYAIPESDLDLCVNVNAPDDELRQRDLCRVINDFLRRIESTLGTEVEPVGDKNFILGIKNDHVDVPAIESQRAYFTDLFCLSVGQRERIDTYRKTVLDALSGAGIRGERIWGDIIRNLFDLENLYFPHRLQERRRTLYPQTLKEARKYFLREK